MITVQSKKWKHKPVTFGKPQEPKVINIHRKSPIRNNNLWRYFFRRVNMSLPGMQKKYRYFPKADTPKHSVKRVGLINMANFLNANGKYKYDQKELQGVEDEKNVSS